MAQIIGTESNDTLTGTDGDDVIEGRGGHDTIRGGLGNDTIYGGDGDDSLYGDGGNDRIEGGAGRNFMNGGAGDDVMIGGDGDDHVYSDEGSDVVELGKGNDYISLVRGTVDTSHVSVALGDGDDSMRLFSYGPTSFAFDFGAGSDRINVELLSGTATITLGAGADIVDLGYLDMGRPPFSGGTVGHMVFTDFETGAAGDRIDWLNGLVKSLTNWNQALNPFGTGHLRLIQSGADAVLQIDRDGGGNSYVTIATFLGRQVGSFTTENFHGYAVDGSLEDGRSISGSIGADTLRGTSGDDFVDGLEGPDKLYGGVGNDRLDGGDGSDQLFGELGGDVLNGGLGGDSLDGGQGDDVLNGDDGDDSLRADAGFDILHGGAGDDYLGFSYVASATGYGGEGMDRFSLYSTTAGGNYTFDGGAGADTFDLLQFRGVLNLTLGSGIDTVIFGNSEPAAFLAGAVVVIADFQAGAGGDVIDIKTMIAGLPSSWDGSENPFGSGRARLLQIGADTALQFDSNGGGDSWKTIVLFTGRTVGGFTAANFGGFAPDGSPPEGLTLTGTAGYDSLRGGAGADTLDGLAGNDYILGGPGGDTIRGGDDHDLLYGEAGNDRIEGGNGNDTMEDGTGDDLVYGGEGNDTLWNTAGSDQMFGDGGNDRFSVQRSGTLAENLTINMGAGNDFAELRIHAPSTYLVDLGDGDDRAELTGDRGTIRMTLGGGRDTVHFATYFSQQTVPTITITDFQVGVGGDRIELAAYLSFRATGWDPSTNPFETGHARLFKSGSDMLLQIDLDGGDNGYRTIATFAGVGPTGFTADNFEWQPRVVTGLNRTGTAAADVLTGSDGDDVLDGGGGSDTLWGGKGDDVYVVDAMGDVVKEFAGEGTDEVRTALGSRSDYAAMYTLAAQVENLTGTSATGQGVNGNTLNNLIKMGAGGDLIVVEQGGNDRVESGGGNDYIYYGATFTNGDSNDGGAGVDTVGLLGNYTLAFDADDLVSIEKLAVYSSGNPAAANSYNLTTIDANVAAGEHLTVIGMSLSAAETLVFNGAAETDGRFTVLGGKGADTITGGMGNDLVWGNLGADTLRGGGGNDSFEYYSIAESTPGARDIIMDFSGGDKINLWGIDADGDASNGNSAFAFIGSGAFTGAAGQLRAVQDANFARAWIVEGDTDGDGQADFSLVVVTQPGYLLGAGDFVL